MPSPARLQNIVASEAFLWGDSTASSYHEHASSHMDVQWDNIISPILRTLPIDYSKTIDFAAGYGRNTRKLLDFGAGHVTMVDVNPECIDHMRTHFTGENTTIVLNDGFDLAGLETGAFTFLYSFDAMVHFDLEIISSYVPEFSRVLKSGAYAFVHHSNYTANPGGDFRDNPHWRNFMSAGIFKHLARRAGFEVVQQTLLNWGEPDNDCITVLSKR